MAGVGRHGIVYLVGAGPGDPGLLTLKGERCLTEAEVVVYDYLANPELLRFAPPAAERVFCGKHGGEARILTQEEINALLIDRAQAGCRVVRLKGGDPLIFGRGGEEAQALAAAGVAFEIVPGVTSATAVPAYAGIPLTHRDVTSTVTFVAGHAAAAGAPAIPWAHLAHGGTLVLMMSTVQLGENLSRLLDHGLSGDTPAALIRWGTMPAQRVVVGTVADLADRVGALRLRPPTIVVIGEVVRLRDGLRWFERLPLSGRSIVVTRAPHQAASFTAQLEALGAGVTHVPSIEVIAPPSYADLDRALADLRAYHWVVFTSVNGVEAFFARLSARAGDTRQLGHVRLAAIGTETAGALERIHLRADVVPEEFRGEGLAAALGAHLAAGQRVLLPRAAAARAVLPEALRAIGVVVDDVAAYAVGTPAVSVDAIRQRLRERSVDLITFASSTTVRHFVKLVGPEVIREAVSTATGAPRVQVGCIGPVTAATARALGLPVDVEPSTYTIAAFTAAIAAHFCKGS
jgi:uroporphyrinogen III methyltransferase/synthase